jgi:MYXO-CTERM domain-containing protein
MFRISVRLMALLLPLAVLAWPTAALANHHHIGGSSSGSSGGDPDADCLVWGYVVANGADAGNDAGADASMSDGGDSADAAQPPDAGTNDAGSGPPAGAVLVCLEHATMFGCDCAMGDAAGEGSSRGAIALVAAALLAARRRRRAASPGGTP